MLDVLSFFYLFKDFKKSDVGFQVQVIFEALNVIIVAIKAIVYIEKGRDCG